METHLLGEIMYSRRYVDAKNVPVHLVIFRESLNCNLQRVKGIYSRNIYSRDGDIIYEGWEKIPFKLLDNLKYDRLFKDWPEYYRYNDFAIACSFSCRSYHNCSPMTDCVELKVCLDTFEMKRLLIGVHDIIKRIDKYRIDTNEGDSTVNTEEAFFDINMVGVVEESVRSSALMTSNGPLEAPSTYRGKEKKQKEADRTAEHQVVRCREPTESICQKWKVDKVEHEPIYDSFNAKLSIAIYRESCIVKTATKINRQCEGRFFFIDVMERESAYLSNVVNKVFTSLTRSIVENDRSFPQMFHCNFRKDFDLKSIMSVIHYLKEVWILNITDESCVVKAVSEHLRSETYIPISVTENDEVWGDLIDYARRSVRYGLKVTLKKNEFSGLYQTYRDGQSAFWEQLYECGAFYCGTDLRVFFVLPGGFGITFDYLIDEQDVSFFRWRFGPAEIVSHGRV